MSNPVNMESDLRARIAKLEAELHEGRVITESLRQDHEALHDLFRRTTGYTATDYIILRQEIRDAPRSNRDWRVLAEQSQGRASKLETDRAELVEALRNLTTQPPRTINFNAARALLARLEAE